MSETHGIDPGEAFIREVDDAVRQDQWKALWAKWGNYVLAVVAGAALAAGGISLYRENEAKKAADASQRFQVASDLAAAGKHDDAALAFEALGKLGAPYGVLARLREAGEKVALNDSPAAIKILDQIAADGSASAEIRDLAALRSVSLGIDTMSLDEARHRLTPLTANSAPFHLTARELLAGAEIKAGDTKAAETDLKAILADASAPPGQHQRVADLLNSLGLESEKTAPGNKP